MLESYSDPESMPNPDAKNNFESTTLNLVDYIYYIVLNYETTVEDDFHEHALLYVFTLLNTLFLV
jgi:hypothetical protein